MLEGLFIYLLEGTRWRINKFEFKKFIILKNNTIGSARLSLLLFLALLRGFFSGFIGFDPSTKKKPSPNANLTSVEDLD